MKAVNNTAQAWHFLGETSGGIYVVRSHETVDFYLNAEELFTVTVKPVAAGAAYCVTLSSATVASERT